MKLQLFFIIFCISGCAQLMKGQTQPVIPKADNTFFTTCSGAVEDWSSCNNKANKKCSGGYEALDKVESPVGGRRELTFRCK